MEERKIVNIIIVTQRSPLHFGFLFPIHHFPFRRLITLPATTTFFVFVFPVHHFPLRRLIILPATKKGEVIHLLAGIPVFGTPACVLCVFAICCFPAFRNLLSKTCCIYLNFSVISLISFLPSVDIILLTC